MIAVLAIMVSGCQKYDDSELRKEIDGLKTRLAAVEALNNYKDLLQKLNSGTVATGYSVSGNEITLTFADGKSLTFNQKGEPGAPGESITGPEGKPGVSPQIKNEDGKWWISTDNGQTWEEAGSSVGTPGKDGITPIFRINEETCQWEVYHEEEDEWEEIGSAMDRSLIAGIDTSIPDFVGIVLADGSKMYLQYADPFEAVDLGLSVKWATCNVGASAPEDPGDFFAWGETVSRNNKYQWANYKFRAGSGNQRIVSKYDANGDGLTVLQPEDDVAHLTFGGKWRMPTKEEMEELLNIIRQNNTNYQCTWTTINGQKGYEILYKANGNSIFLPATGTKDSSWPTDLVSLNNGFYWTSTLYSATLNYVQDAWRGCFGETASNKANVYKTTRSDALFVRPVRE